MPTSGICRRVDLAWTCSRWFLARGFFYPEDGGDMFLRNVGSHKIYNAPHPRSQHSSQCIYFFRHKLRFLTFFIFKMFTAGKFSKVSVYAFMIRVYKMFPCRLLLLPSGWKLNDMPSWTATARMCRGCWIILTSYATVPKYETGNIQDKKFWTVRYLQCRLTYELHPKEYQICKYLWGLIMCSLSSTFFFVGWDLSPR
jgi:hypothetical protein